MEFSIDDLRDCAFFSDFVEDDLVQIYGKLVRQDLDEGEYLVKENEPGDCLYILVKGKLIATTGSKARENIIGYVKPGEVVGELSIFSNAPRSASVKAVYPSIVMRLKRQDFQALCFKNPKILWEVSSTIADRAQSNIQLIRSEKRGRHQTIVLISLCQKSESAQLIDEIKKQNVEKLNLNVIEYSALSPDVKPTYLINQSLKKRCSVVYFLQDHDLEKNVDVLNLADKVVLIIDPETTDFAEVKRWNDENGKILSKIENELVLLHHFYQACYPNTKKYLQLGQFARSHHLALDTPLTIQRMLRFWTGNAIGLVLSGGGAKGWAVVGAMKALSEHKIAVDYIGGTSIGGIIAAIYATTDNYDAFYQKVYEMITYVKPFELHSLTWPIISLFCGKKETVVLQDAFVDICIEDLALPFFTMSANISSYGQNVWDRGLLWEACRATSAIPPLLPPLTYHDQVHIDGGIINNFPIDIMSEKLDKQGYIIGVDISSTTTDIEKYNFPPVIKFWDGLKIRLKLNRGTIKFLSIAEIMERTMMTASVDRTMQNDKLCDLLIKPNLDNYRITDFSKKDEMFEVGYKEAKEQLQKWSLK